MLTLWPLSSGAALAAAAAEPARPASAALTGAEMLQWLFGLIVVLIAILACAWLLRKLGHFPVGAAAGLRIIGGISLGGREKVLLLQAGKKHLVLGVTPGRIATLYVLGEDEMAPPPARGTPGRGGFAERLQQAMKGRGDG